MQTEISIKRVTPRIPGGFPEYLPKEQILFNRMFATIRSVYERFGFLPLETPAVEFTGVLLAKGGGDTDKQVYRLYAKSDSADKGDAEEPAADSNGATEKKTAFIDTGRSLHFDLTVPLARYVAQRFNDLVFPFRRYQMQKVWRGEGSQKGRFREFYQCDIDVIGTTSPLVDAEIPSIINTVFEELGLPAYTIGVNNRKILNGVFATFGASKQVSKDALTMLDKIDKIGKDSVTAGLCDLGFTAEQTAQLMNIIALRGEPGEVFVQLQANGVDNELFSEGVGQLKLVVEAMQAFGVPKGKYCLDLSIARGLDYYTGTVYETTLNDYPAVGSVCSGGRYDNLCEYYIDKNLPGVGISIGLSRLFYQLKDIGFFQGDVTPISRLMIAIADPSARQYAMTMAAQFRQHGVNTEVYWEDGKLGKQVKYAQRLGIPYVAVLGGNEMTNGTVALKVMSTGSQTQSTFQEALQIVSADLN